MSINLSDIATLNIKGSNYCCIISLISKIKAMNLLPKKAEHYKKRKIKKKKTFLKAYIIMGKSIIKIGDIEMKKKITNIKNLFQ